ncbi:MAG: hypothetical protein VB934_01775 [Polyangiaceae bacterium]
MMRRRIVAVGVLLNSWALGMTTASQAAAPSEAKATKAKASDSAAADAKALNTLQTIIQENYLEMEFPQAANKLEELIKSCASSCSAPTRARVQAAYGVVLFAGLQENERGSAAFVEALTLDPTVTLDDDLSTKKMRAAFDEAKAKAKAAGVAIPETGAAKAKTPETPPAPVATNETAKPLAPKAEADERVCCDTGAECPPGFPICGQEGLENWMPCESDGDCKNGYSCDGASCKPNDSAKADEPAGDWAKNWLSLSAQQDFVFFGSEANVCSGGNQYYCYYEGDVYYEGIPQPGDQAQVGNAVGGGVGVATTRLMLGYDRSLFENFSLGVRLGYAFGGGPEVPNGSAFLPVHAAGRVGYWFGSEPFGRTGLRPFVFLTGGMAQIDTRVLVTVYEGDDAYVNDQRTKLHAWRKAGSAFVGGGVGTSFQINNWAGFSAEMKIMQTLGSTATGMSLNLGYTVGL